MIRKMNSCSQVSQGLGLKLLSDDDLYQIHLASLELLNQRGIFVEDQESVDMLCDHGCWVDSDKCVRFPASFVEDCIRWAPSSYVACGRNPEDDTVYENNRVNFTNFGEGIVTIDPFTQERRATTKKDAMNIALACDSLKSTTVYQRAVLSHDVPQQVSALHNAEASLLNCRKHHHIGMATSFEAKNLVKMAAVIAGGEDKLRDRPTMTFNNCPVSPMRIPLETCKTMRIAAENHIANMCLAMVQPGATGPATMAGCLAQHNAEILAMNCLVQITRKGAGFIYGSSACSFDMKTGVVAVGSPEAAIINAGLGLLSQKLYKLPCFLGGG